jgi:molybdate/tungstate transport system substrate-binding protein
MVKLGALAVGAGLMPRLLAQALADLDVASAGAMKQMLDGPLKTAVAEALTLNLRSHSQGADAVAKALVGGSLQADVFIPITAGPMHTVMAAGMAAVAMPVARTEIVIPYSPKSKFADKFDAAAKGKANWWDVLQEPGLKFLRSDPGSDPGGRCIIFTMMLAAKKYRQADLVERVLGGTLNPEQILSGGSNQSRMASGELDATGSYRSSAVASGFPYIVLPSDINLSSLNVRRDNPEVRLSVGDKTFYPEPTVFYAAVLKGASNVEGAEAFVRWLTGEQAQGVFRAHEFAAAGEAAEIEGPFRWGLAVGRFVSFAQILQRRSRRLGSHNPAEYEGNRRAGCR